MQNEQTLEDLRKIANRFDADTVSLYVPKPAIEVHGEKWRILRSNLLREIQNAQGTTDAMEAWLENLEIDDFIGNGKAAFERDGELKTADLNARPHSILSGPAPVYLTPLLADLDNREQAWIVEVNHEKAGLYFFDGQNFEDHSDRLNVPDYAQVVERRDINNDVFFHSASRGGLGQSHFHALGTSRQQEEEKTETAFFHEIWSALAHVLPSQTRTIHAVGTPGTVGHFAELAPDAHWSVVQHESGDGVQGLEVSDFHVEEELPDDVSLHKLTAPELDKAAGTGQISACYFNDGMVRLDESDSGKADEHFRVEAIDVGDTDMRMADICRKTLANGGLIHFIPSDLHAESGLAALRW